MQLGQFDKIIKYNLVNLIKFLLKVVFQVDIERLAGAAMSSVKIRPNFVEF
jgi:hypothetical protein